MKTIIGIKSLALTCCAVGVLASSGQVWAIDNCTQVTAQDQADVDSVANDRTGATDAETQANILALNPTGAANDPDSPNDDEDCAAVTPIISHDFGDAPLSYMTSGAGAAQHEVVPWLRLGAEIDAEADGPLAPGTGADVDDVTDTPDDEDGVDSDSLVMSVGESAPVLKLLAPLNTSGADAYVACWIDYDNNGTFDAGEFGEAVVPDNNIADIDVVMPDVPATVAVGDAIASGIDSYARCRLSNVQLTAAQAAGVVDDGTYGVSDGEVEDYPVNFVPVLDLALDKKLADGQADTVQAGDDVVFTITVHNQGTADVTGIIITDYIPAGMELNDANWTASADGSTATLNAANALTLAANGESTVVETSTVNITLTVKADTAAGAQENRAEISAFTAIPGVGGNPLTDIDSTPDADNTDTVKDDVINEDGKAAPANDEDDHDLALVTVGAAEVDIELEKRVLNKAGTAEVTEAFRGDDVMYELVVTNHGPDTATSVTVTDLLPTGVTYKEDNTATVTDSTGAATTYNPVDGQWVIGTIHADDSITLRITVTIQ